MNKVDIIKYISEEMGTTKVQAAQFMDIMLYAIQKNVRREGVKITGLGTFQAVKRKARKGRNPKNGEVIKIPAKWSPTFKPSSALRQAVKKR